MRTTPEIDSDQKIVDPNVVATLPKAELHDHLDGGLRPATILELATEIGYEGLPESVTSLPEAEQADALEKWFFDAANSGDLPTYLTTFAHTCAVMQTAAAIERVAREAVEDLAADHVVYAELRFAPEQHQEKGLSLQEVVDAAIAGVKEGEKNAEASGNPITARLLLCGMRHAERTAEIAQLTIDNVGEGDSYVVGYDIAGAEDGFPPSKHAEAFAALRQSLVPVTIHAGEAAGLDSIEDALVQGALRLGHGARIYEDFGASLDGIELHKLSRFVRDRQRVLELCPTSNVQTGVCDSLDDHPFPLLYDLGFTCTVNTDNRLVSGTSMTKEMMILVDHYDFGYEELLQLTINAIDAAFLPLPERERILSQIIFPAYHELLGHDDEEFEEEEAGLGHTHGGHGGHDGHGRAGQLENNELGALHVDLGGE